MSNASAPVRDVTVIGAGPAGSAVAYLLARQGWDVTLVEQHRFPRDKVCGECLSGMGIDVLRRMGLGEWVRCHGAAILRRTCLHAERGQSAEVELPRPMWGLSRQVLDELLLQASAEAGVRIHQPARAESLLPGPPVTLAVRDLLTNAVEVTTPGLVIVADGKAALSPRPPPPTADFGVKTHFVHVDGPRDAIELFGTSGTYGGLAPIEQRRWNAAFSVPAPLLRQHAGNLEQLFERLVAANVTLRERMRRAERVSPWLASPLPRYAVTRDWPDGVLAVGNAAAALEPIGGEGMGLALRSAELVVEALAEVDNDMTKLDRVGLMRRYNSLWRTRRAACRAAAKVVSSGRMAGAAMELLRADERAGRAAMGWMGKNS
jgi:2-polyprenyl-6-methoxyphenol hydroxylase-like FAD-dependent oxidoreductase